MKNFSQGGQISIHSFRMNVVVFRFLIKLFLLFFILAFLSKNFSIISKKDIGYSHDYFLAKFISLYQKNPNYKININKNGKSYKLSIGYVINNSKYLKAKKSVTNSVKYSLKFSIILSSAMTFMVALFFYIRGIKTGEKTHIRGGSLSSIFKLKIKLKRYNIGIMLSNIIKNIISFIINIFLKIFNIKAKLNFKKNIIYNLLPNVSYPINTETQHTIITGGSGTGKTQMLLHLLDQIRKNGDRAIVYDKMGSFIPKFYNEKKDIILNPFDKRSPSWSIFNEVKEDIFFDSIATALIPMEKNSADPFWTKAARTIFTSVASKLRSQGETSNKNLIDNLLKIDLSNIANLIKDTPAQAIIDERSPKTALSVMSVLSTYLASLKYLKDPNEHNDECFSIRDWVENDVNDGSFLFISSRSEQHEALKPLISTWLEIAINSLLSLNQDQNRRIWIILDELPSLHMIPSLNSGIAQSRQFGGCFALALQLMAQLRSIYGRDDAETISGLAKTRVVFASPDEDTARWCSESLGKIEQEEIKKNISYGSHEVRDGISLNSQLYNKNLVIPTDIMNLKNLECYVKLPFDFPISKTKIKVHNKKDKAEKFIFDKGVIEKKDIQKKENKGEINIRKVKKSKKVGTVEKYAKNNSIKNKSTKKSNDILEDI